MSLGVLWSLELHFLIPDVLGLHEASYDVINANFIFLGPLAHFWK